MIDSQEIDDLFHMFAASTDTDAGTKDGATRIQMEAECRFCSSTMKYVLDGVWTCMGCYTVSDRVLDYGAEWRAFQNDNGSQTDMSRCSALNSDLIAPLGCVLRAGNSCSAAVGQRTRVSRAGLGAVMMSKHQSWNALTYRERSLCKVFELISARSAVHNIPSAIVQEAKQMYKQVSCGRIFRGEARVAVIAACVYMALRSSHAPRSVCEVAGMFEIASKAAMIRGCNLFHSALPRLMETTRTMDFVARFCCRLGLSEENTEVCRKIAKMVDEQYIVSDCSPPSIVGAIIHMVNLRLVLNISRNSISEACMVSSGAIARCCRRLLAYDCGMNGSTFGATNDTSSADASLATRMSFLSSRECAS